MMKHFSLRSKVLMLVSVPLIVMLFMGLLLWNKERADYASANSEVLYVDAIKNLFLSVHEVQAERGRSIMFINAATSSEELSVQRKKSDEKLAQASAAILSSPSTKEVIEVWRQIEVLVQKTRATVDGKPEPPVVLKDYMKLISSIISLESQIATLSPGAVNLFGPIMLETAKENAGRLRALSASLIKADVPLTPAQVGSINEFLSTINANMNSPVLKISAQARQNFSVFLESNDWVSFTKAAGILIAKASEGAFGLDSKVIFDNATASMNNLLEIFKKEFEQVTGQAQLKAASALQNLIIYSVGVIVGVLLSMGLGLIIYLDINKSMRASVNSLNTTSVQISQSFEQLREASQAISSGSTQSAAALEETVASVEEISSMVSANADNSTKAAELSKNSCNLAEAGEVKIKSLIHSMKELSAYSTKIENIVGVIDDIAFQINLLALNAAVEAARAGEQGKGFAVVAEAVRDLAQKSATAAKEISALIQESVTRTQGGALTADESGVALQDILKSVKDVTVIIEEIAKSSQEQSKGLTQISGAMNQLDQSTQANASSAEQTSAAAESLSGEASNLKELIVNLNSAIDGQKKAA